MRAVRPQLLELLAQPTIDCSLPASRLDVWRWRRINGSVGGKYPVPDRLDIHLAILRKEGTFARQTPNDAFAYRNANDGGASPAPILFAQY